MSTRRTSVSGSRSPRSSFLRSVGGPAILLLEQVAHAAHRPDLDAEGLELAAHAVHADLDRVAADLLAPAEHAVGHLLLGDDASLARHEELHDGKLARGEIDGLSLVEDAARGKVEHE